MAKSKSWTITGTDRQRGAIDDIRLDVPIGRDFLASSYDGGYRWCEHCGPVAEDDTCRHLDAEERALRSAQ